MAVKRTTSKESKKVPHVHETYRVWKKKIHILNRRALCGVHELTIRIIRHSEDSTTASVATGLFYSAKLTFIPRDQNNELMQKALNV
jgi:hypothetical protein